LSASGRERMVNGRQAASVEESMDLSAGIARFGAILKWRSAAPSMNHLGEIGRPFTLCYKVSGPSALPPCFERVAETEKDEND